MATDERNLEDRLGDVNLYYDVQRIYRELEELGYGRTDPLKIEDLVKVDQYHYYGVKSVDHAIKVLGIQPEDTVLDIGSGLGGPARYVAHVTKCQVTALEIQHDLDVTAEDLTKRCNLDKYVTHVCDDFLTVDFGTNKYDYLLSWLVFLHIPDKEAVFEACFRHLKPGGKIYVEDMFAIGKFTKSEDSAFQSVVYSENLKSKDGYKEGLQKAGFIDVQITDMTDDWTNYTSKRYEEYKLKRDDHIRVLGKESTQQLEEFYKVVAESFGGGHLGGGQIVATKP
ncbi:uncharacterized protein LOC144436609 [Glandiceps talaboti]